MSGLGAVGGADKQYANLPTKTVDKKESAVQAEPKDMVEIQKNISLPRKVIEKVIGSPVGLVTTAANAVGGLFGGGVAGVKGRASSAEGPHGLMSGAAYVGIGATAGAMLATPIVGGIVGGVVGLVMAILSGTSGSMEKIGEHVGDKAKAAVSDNEPSESKVRDTTLNFTEGAVVGTIHGSVQGFKQGTSYGAGIVSGAIEGTKGFVGALAGTYEKDEATKPDEGQTKSFGKKVLNAILSVPRKVARGVVGTATGLTGSALGVVDGAIQGTIVGGTEDEEADAGAHNIIRGIETTLAGAGVGLMMGGPLGAGIGAGAGLLTGIIMGKISKHTDADEEFAQGITDAVKHAQSDNVYKNKPDEYGDREKVVYETFRDGIEGTMTGTGAGVREGFKEGYQVGKGVVDGVFDAGKGIIKGIAGGIKGL
ncbi:MAG: hypothetical protein K8T10_05325 [Candidatus Eremiobacteraeota bacterium]|nr:hypothetical protein [Candidatus Eremiobacteraeota bacterium]